MTRARHEHPSLRRPVSFDRFRSEILRALQHAVKAGAAPPVHAIEIHMTRALSRTHARNARRYAQVSAADEVVFEFAPEVLLLPRAHRLGLIAHEIGHVIAWHERGKHRERDADEAAERVLGVRVEYDMRWPGGRGRGLQRGRRVR